MTRCRGSSTVVSACGRKVRAQKIKQAFSKVVLYPISLQPKAATGEDQGVPSWRRAGSGLPSVPFQTRLRSRKLKLVSSQPKKLQDCPGETSSAARHGTAQHGSLANKAAVCAERRVQLAASCPGLEDTHRCVSTRKVLSEPRGGRVLSRLEPQRYAWLRDRNFCPQAPCIPYCNPPTEVFAS